MINLFHVGFQIKLREEIANRSLTYVDWSRGGWHPATFGFWEATEEWLQALKVRAATRC